MGEPTIPEQGQPPPDEPPRQHPVRLVVTDDLRRSRLTVAFRLLLVIPHLIWLALYSIAAWVVALVNWFATLITGRSPERIHNYLVRYMRYSIFVTSYLNLLANPYPPFHGTEGSYPIALVVEGPERQNRLITAFRLPMAIPAYILNYVFNQVLQVVAFLGWFVAIVIGRMPRGMENLGLYCLRYQAQTNAYLFVVSDRYPSLTA
jgi:hypothetical protein